ncbi:hypothetical protein WH95_18630 [Kiloniella litopenaei]|uniref:Uncharacterized protein n=1 Tax=Kiloniella litopenaei TaxID=1549748 RepID=A0A0M2R0N4_9PROT|nr:hypothetical protein [Kiloniella litopenaei]KKJ75457.1 hypothetical protein WH95_18630 [Kiloniella litopenaei]
MSASTLATINALFEVGMFAFKAYHAVQSGDKTPEQIRAEWDVIKGKMESSWDAWDAAGKNNG